MALLEQIEIEQAGSGKPDVSGQKSQQDIHLVL